MSARRGAWRRAKRGVATATAATALGLGLSRCLLVAPERDELMDGASSTGSGGSTSSSSASAGGGGASSGGAGAGGDACQVERFMELDELVQPRELGSSATHVYWSTIGSTESLVQRKAKQGQGAPEVLARLALGREARFLGSADGRLFWVALGAGKDSIDTPAGDGGAPLAVLETGTSRAFAVTEPRLLWATGEDDAIHVLVEGNDGMVSDGGATWSPMTPASSRPSPATPSASSPPCAVRTPTARCGASQASNRVTNAARW